MRAPMTRQLTVRSVPDEVARRLKALSDYRKTSMNAALLEILEAATGYEPRLRRLERYATWTEADRLEFEAALAPQRPLDDADWS
jgi:plasmid stability protein